jgi:hypothetical protein
MPTLPSRAVLRAAYDTAILEIDRSRTKPMLTTAFYARIGDSVFDACYLALADHCDATAGEKKEREPAKVHVVSAPVGAGKTSFSVAFLAAFVRVTEHDGDAPQGAVFLADQITKADEVYRQLAALVPGKVAIWTQDHDSKRSAKAKVQDPAACFEVDALRLYPLAIVTHAFYNGTRGHKARNIFPFHQIATRALTIVDEKPNEVDIFAVTYSQAERVWDVVSDDPEAPDHVKHHLTHLRNFMGGRAMAQGDLETPRDAPDAWGAADALSWFATEPAGDFTKSRHYVPSIEQVFGFAEALAVGQAFVARNRGGQGRDAIHRLQA